MIERRRNNVSADSDVWGKIPPQNVEMEEAVLGALMIESSAIVAVQSMLIPDMFYRENHRCIAKAILALAKERQSIDLLTVTEQLRSAKELEIAGGPFYIATLTNKVGSAAHIEHHIRIVFEKYIQRRMIEFSSGITVDAYNDDSDVFELFDKAEKDFRDINSLFRTGSMPSMSTMLERADQQMSTGHVKSKHRSLNENFGGGWQMGTLNVLAARPGMGKTAVLISELMSAAERKEPVAAFMLEMLERQTAMRMICNKTKIPNTRYKDRAKWHARDEEQILAARKWIMDSDSIISMDFTPGISVYELIAKARKIKREKGLRLLFIDYLQLMTVPAEEMKGKTKDQQIGIITQALKTFAKEENIAIVLFCQLSRAVEDIKDKVPSLTHLRESGNIEQDADTVLFLLRPEYYFDRDEFGHIIYANSEQEAEKDVCYFICAKNRDGSLFESAEKCDMATSNFENLIEDTPF